jgi:drug/metabolite transporter (DMT)-like permease
MFFGLWFWAAGSVAPGETAVLVYTFPLWVTLLSGPVLRASPGRFQLPAVLLGLVGVILVSRPWDGGLFALAPVSVAAILLAAVAWAFGTVLFKRRFTGTQVAPANAVQLVGGAGALALASLILEGTAIPTPSLPVLATVLWLGLVGTSLAYAIWFYLLDGTAASTLSAYTFLVPLVALVASALLLGEPVVPVEGAGVAIVVAALLLNGRATSLPSVSS